MKRDIFQAIADPTRRAIILLLAYQTQTLTPSAIAAHFDVTRQAISKHIRVLSECQLLKQQNVGREIYYQLTPKKIQEVEMWLRKFRKQWEDRFSQLDDVLHNMKGAKK